MNYTRNLGVLLVGALLLGGCDSSINSSIVVADGESRLGSLMSVNGDVLIGKDCTIEGTSNSVNGLIKVGDRSRVEDLSTVNGSIRTGKNVNVNGNAESINGTVELGAGSEVSGDVSTVTGSIVLEQTVIQRGVQTVNGNIELRDKSVVKGDIVIEDNKGVIVKKGVIVIKDKKGVSTRTRPIEIEVTGGSIIEGDVMVKRNVEVRLILSGGGKVLGQVDGAEVIDKNVAQPALDD